MEWKPNKWIAAILSFFVPSLGMLYVGRPRLAGVYFIGLLTVALALVWLNRADANTSQYVQAASFTVSIFAAIHSYRIASRASAILARPWFGRWYWLLAMPLAAFLAIFSFRVFLFEPFRIPSQSMFPSIPAGSFVAVRKTGYGNYGGYGIHLFRTRISAPLTRGDVLVFEFPQDRSKSFAQRLIGLPGDHIEYRNKRLYVNGSLLPTDPIRVDNGFDIVQEAGYPVANERDVAARDFDIEVEPGHLFVMGDNRDRSNDSRYWGQVPYDHVVGKVVLELKNPNVSQNRPGSP